MRRLAIGVGLLATTVVLYGCSRLRDWRTGPGWERLPTYYDPEQTRIEYPSVQSYLEPEVVESPPPLMLENPADLPTRELALNEAIEMALSNTDVLRSLGGSVVQAPAASITRFDPALVESNPAIGVEAALSAFDAQVASQLFWNVDDRPNNILINPILSQFQRSAFQQTAATFNYEIAKRTATGARFAARHVFNYDLPNTPNRLFSSAYNGWVEFEYRQPLLRGAGVDFNRIAGPNSPVGQYNGVLIARINTDVSLADFEAAVISFINDVETAYWELYFAYHNLESLVAGRNAALLTWQRTKELQRVGARGGDAAAEAQARSNYFNFDVQVKDALSGPNGLYAAEQRLRYLLGLPPSDGSLLKPVTPPMDGPVEYDWRSALHDALTQRVEIRRQKWNVKRRQLELMAAKMNLLPTLDFLGLYRYRGLGDALIDSRDPNNSFNSLYQSILEGDFQEWQAGIELTYPVGLRQAATAVANARWNLARAQAILKEQELKISHDLADAARRVKRAYELLESNYNRQLSDQAQVEALQARYESGLDNINFLLQAQQQLASSQIAFFRSLVDYQLALRDFHREKGSLLTYNRVSLAEDSWPSAAYQDAAERGRFFTPRLNPDAIDVQPSSRVSDGPFDPSTIGERPPEP